MTRYVQSARIFGPTQIGNAGSSAVYTVPTGFVAVIRLLSIVNTGSSGTASVRAAISGNAVSTHVIRLELLTATSAQYDTRLVLRAGDDFRIWNTNTGTTVTAAGHGFLFHDP